MSKFARTHDTSLIDYHVTDVAALGKVLNDAVAAACPKSSGLRYLEVYVLLLSWEDDDLGVDAEIDALEEVFRTIYGYATERWKIPSSMSHNALVFRLMQCLQHFESSDKLFITYYGGHGYMNDDRQCVWLCNRKPNAATVQWSSIQTMLEEAACDVLILLDCCAAASSGGNTGKGVTEVIAACGFEAFAPGVGPHSFTSNLTEELRYLGRSKPSFTTAFLHNKVLARLKKSWNPRYAAGDQQERRRTPIYIHFADGEEQRCIQLGFPPRSKSLPTSNLPSVPSTQSSAPSTSQSDLDDVDMSGIEDISQSSVSSSGLSFTEPQVLISVALEGEQMLHTSDWLEWLKSFPAIARSVHIEGVYKSDSTLLHLSLPVAVWDAIPRDPAIAFLAFISTKNLARTRKDKSPRSSKTKIQQPTTDASIPLDIFSPAYDPFAGFNAPGTHAKLEFSDISARSTATTSNDSAIGMQEDFVADADSGFASSDFRLYDHFDSPHALLDMNYNRAGPLPTLSPADLEEYNKRDHPPQDKDVNKEENQKKRKR